MSRRRYRLEIFIPITWLPVPYDFLNSSYSLELMLENAARFNTMFGGITPRASNALYVHGQLDPWRTVGVQTNDNKDTTTTVIVIEGNYGQHSSNTTPGS